MCGKSCWAVWRTVSTTIKGKQKVYAWMYERKYWTIFSNMVFDVYSLIILISIFRTWDAVEKRLKIQYEKCTAIFSIALQRRHIIRDKDSFLPLLNANMLSLAVLETMCHESDDLKTLEQQSTLLVDDLLLLIGNEIIVGILQYKLVVHIFPCISIPVCYSKKIFTFHIYL